MPEVRRGHAQAPPPSHRMPIARKTFSVSDTSRPMRKTMALRVHNPAPAVAGKRIANDRVVKSAPRPRKPIPGRGSAIFLHHARPGFTPTDGCIAVDEQMMRKLLARIGPRTRILIG